MSDCAAEARTAYRAASPLLTPSATPWRCVAARDSCAGASCVRSVRMSAASLRVLTQRLQGVRTTLPSLFIRGRLVRFIHLPEALDPERAIEEHRRKLVDAELHYARKHAGGASGAGRTEATQQARGEEDAGADGARTAEE